MPIPSVDPTAKSLPRRLAVTVVRTRFGKWVLREVSPRLDPPLLRLSRGRLSSTLVTPGLLLTTTGAKSGLERATPLTYFTDGDRVILMASNYGGTRHPGWYYNIKAHPEVSSTAAGYQGRFIAEEVTGAERDRLWSLAKQFIASYGDYELTAGHREIPIVALSPVG